MTISPYSYAFILEQDYNLVRDWVQTGKLPDSHHYLVGILRSNRELITAWVEHNEAHRRMISRNSNITNPPLFSQSYAEFCQIAESVVRFMKRRPDMV